MNNKNKKSNPQNDPTIQIMLDLERTIKEQKNINTELLNSYYDFFKKLKQEPIVISKNSARFNQHRYNEKKMHFVKITDFNHSQCIENLSANAVKILIHMIKTMSQINVIIVKVKILIDKLHMSQNPIRNGLSELEENGCITKICENKKSAIGTLYMINPNIACKSKYEKLLHKVFEKITPKLQIHAFWNINQCNSSAISVLLPIDKHIDVFPQQTILANQIIDKIHIDANIQQNENQDKLENIFF